MTTVQTILEGAYNRYSANDPGKLAQDPELIAHLSRVYERTWPLIARARPDQFQAEAVLTLASYPPSVALPANMIDLLAVFNAASESVWVIPATDRNRVWQLAPCVFRVGGTLRSRFASGDPVAGDVLTVSLLDAPAALTTLTSVIDPRWPVRHIQLLVDELAAYLGIKDAGRSDADRNALLADLKRDALALAAEFQLAPEAVEWIHGEVERASGSPA